ncbi:MAG: hypothetical protein HY428_02700 [Candidatus Levybacteria bacterium]|nr:hypothetical protein [Candidatus Levybacteria bacterium]
MIPQRIVAIGSNSLFGGVYPIDESKTAPLTYWKKGYFYLMNDATELENSVKDVCKSENVPYFDIWSEWMKEDYRQWLFEDGLHANAVGHQRIFDKLRDFLDMTN